MNAKITRRDFIKTAVIGATGALIGCSIRNRFDLVIRGGLIVDGTGAAGMVRDIGIRGDRIVAIDDLAAASADQVLDAQGLVVAPGFIDIHTHTDAGLLVYPGAESKIHQGVTTEVGGNCGDSPFPLNDRDWAELDREFFETYGWHVDWRDIGDFLSRLEQRKISINYAALTGHGTLRGCVVGHNDVAATAEQMAAMKQRLAHTMEQGSYGLSTGLEYAPGSYAGTEELIELCKTVAQHDGIYATHIRNEDDQVEAAVAEALRICREAEVSLQISHLKTCNQSNWHKADSLLEMIHGAAAAGMPVHAYRYPYIAYATGLTIFLPLWSRQGSTDEILQRLGDPQQFSKIANYVESRGQRIGGWDRVVISSCVSAKNKIWEGKSIQECAATVGKSAVEFIRGLLIDERNRVGIVGFAMSEDNLKKVLASPLVMIGSDGSAIAPTGKAAEGKPHPRYYGTFPRVLGKYCRQEKVFDLPTAVKKMTSLPAEKMGFRNRGKIARGYFADITIFDPETIIDRASFVDPHQFPTGIEYVIVNGQITIKRGQHTGARAGVVLRHVG